MKKNLVFIGAVLVGLHASIRLFSISRAAMPSPDTKLQWDIINLTIDPGPPLTLTITPGGQATMLAVDNSKITLNGSGTFRTAGNSQNVTGGGTWVTRDSSNNVTGSGTYQVTGFVAFDVAAGTLVVPGVVVNDSISNPADARSGLVYLHIAYSDGSQGILTVSCELLSTPPQVFEGVATSKGPVAYLQHGGDTVFHVVGP